MRFGSLFAGIGGLDLGLERAGMECAWQVEIDDYCTRVLAKHWPDVPKYKDVCDVGKQNLEPVDLIAGGFPCQPHSVAGKRKGAEDDRNLWPEYLRIVREVKPRYVLGENVLGIVSTYIDTVLSDLESEGYTCTTFNIPAVAFDAPHRRERIFVVAYTISHRSQGSRENRKTTGQVGLCSRERSNKEQGVFPNPKGIHGIRSQKDKPINIQESGGLRGGPWTVEPDVGRVAHGIPSRVDRLRGLGNAVVPQVAEWIGRRIMEHNLAQFTA